MCETRDPITGKVDTKALCRLSIVDADTPNGPVLLDTLVKPKWPVVDYRTWINGISAENLSHVEFTLDHAQAFMDALCSDQTVIIGHAVHNDLSALKLDHGCIVDTAMLYSHAAVTTTDESNAEGNSSSGGLTPSLRNLAHGVLGGREMPDVHDSVNDARVALACAQYYVDMGGKVNTIDKVYKRSDRPNNNSSNSTPGGGGGGRNGGGSDQQHTAILLVHRLPVNTLPEHLTEMFLAYSSIRPKTVPGIAYNGVHGKCHVEFTSAAHAELAYSTLVGEERADKTGKMQKRVGLKGGGYVCVRKMKKENNNKGGATTPQK
jgi:RNA exonuclease 1